MLNEINDLINKATEIFESEADWLLKYELIFRLKIAVKIKEKGLSFKWHDTDTSYEEDIRAYYSALLEFQQRISAVLGIE